VLLDELDRMQKDEMLTLLKVIRGLSALPNITFVCALDLEELSRIISGDQEMIGQRYFEKFFPVTVPLPDPDSTTLKSAGVQRVCRSLEQRGWFADSTETDDFENALSDIWVELIAPFCSNLRSIGLLANDVGVAAAMLRREVDPVDLTLIEMVRRFRPSLYGVISKNMQTLTGGESIGRGGTFMAETEEQDLAQALLTDVAGLSTDKQETGNIKLVLNYLFPKFAGIDGRRARRNMLGRSVRRDLRIRKSPIRPCFQPIFDMSCQKQYLVRLNLRAF